MGKFQVILYENWEGKKIIQEYILKLDKRRRTKIYRQIEYLLTYGITRDNPALKKIANTPLWESRVLEKDNIRLLVSKVESSIVILNIFTKKSKKTPESEIKLAIKRLSGLNTR